MTEKRKGPRYLPAALATMGALVLLVAACETPVPTDPADLQEITAGKQLTQIDLVDDGELHRLLEEEGDLTLVIEETDGETFVVSGVKLAEIREEGHAELLLKKLKEHGEVKLTLVHEDGTLTYGSESDEAGSTLELRTETEAAKQKQHLQQIEAAEMEAKKKTEGGSR